MPRHSDVANPFFLPPRPSGARAIAAAAKLVLLAVLAVLAGLPSASTTARPPAVLTSGGKFAARVAEAGPALPALGSAAQAIDGKAMALSDGARAIEGLAPEGAGSAWSLLASVGSAAASRLSRP